MSDDNYNYNNNNNCDDDYSDDYDNNDNNNNIIEYVDIFEQYDIASKIVFKLREYIMSHGLDMLTSDYAIGDMIMLM